MRAFFNSEELSQLTYLYGTDETIRILVTDEDGIPIDVSGTTNTLLVYTGATRDATPAFTYTLNAVAGQDGQLEWVIPDNFTDLTIGSTSYLWVQIDAAGDISLSRGASVLNVS